MASAFYMVLIKNIFTTRYEAFFLLYIQIQIYACRCICIYASVEMSIPGHIFYICICSYVYVYVLYDSVYLHPYHLVGS